MGPLAATIERALRSDDAEERRQGTTEIGGLPVQAALPLLLSALGDEDWRVRKEATIAARAFGAAPELMSALVGVLAESDNVGLRNAAVDVLAGAGAGATLVLGEALGRLDADGRKLVVETLGKGRDPAALGPLGAALDDADPNVRQGAIEAVAGLGSLARDHAAVILLARLDDADRVVRLVALEGLTALEVPVPWARLEPLLDEPTLRAAAISAASLSDAPEAPRALAGVLAQARGNAFDQALRALGRLADGPLAAAVSAALSEGGADLGRRLTSAATPDGRGEETAPRRATALRLASLAAAAGRTPELLAVVIDAALAALADELLAEPAQRALATLGAPALGALTARLAGSSLVGEARAALVDAVGDVARGAAPIAAAEALAALRSAARDADRLVAVRALFALSRLGGAEDLELLAELTLEDARPLAAAAESALAALSARSPDAARALADRLSADERSLLPAAIAIGAASAASPFEERDATFLAHAATAGDPRARRAAVRAVAEVRATAGAAFPGATEVLRIALADEEHEVQIAAARALGRLCSARDPLRASDVLDVVDRSGEAELVAAAVRAIGEGLRLAHGVPDPPLPPADLVPALGLFARGAPSPVAIAAVEALGHAERTGAPSAIGALGAALDHPDEAVVKAALLKLSAALGEGAPALDALARGLSHPMARVRVLAVELLVDAEPEEARRRLVQKLATESDRHVKDAIQRALGPASSGSPSSLAADRGEGSS